MPLGHVINEKVQSIMHDVRSAQVDRDIEPDERMGFLHQLSWLQWGTRATCRAIENIATKGGQAFKILMKHLSTYRFEKDINALTLGRFQHLFGPSWLFIVSNN